MIVIEFFCANARVAAEFANRGHQAITLDKDKKWKPTLCMDILDFKPELLSEQFRKPFFAWFSPDCTQYSHAKRTGMRDLNRADSYVKKSLQIIEQMQIPFWIIENPQTGLLKTRDFIQGISYVDVSYCKYGLPYRKQTRLWNNLVGWQTKPICKRDCNFLSEDKKRHIASVGNYRKKYAPRSLLLRQRYNVPEELIRSIADFIEFKFLSLQNKKEDYGLPPTDKQNI